MNKGFTLIETLVAITILMISIVGPLTIAQKSFMAAITARDQVIASFLAQDMMEQLKNDRDNALLKGTFTDWTRNLSGLNSNPACTGANSCSVYINADGTYTNNSTQNLSKFTRWAYLSNNVVSNVNHEVKVTVIVKWKVGTIDNFVKLENNFYDVTL